MFPPLFFFSSSKSHWRGLGKSSLKKKQRSLWGREKRWRESIKCGHWRRPRQLNQGDTDFSLSDTIAPARTAWEFMKCFWTRIPDRSSLHNLCFMSAGNLQKHTARSNVLSCLPFFFLKNHLYLGQALNRLAYLYPSPCPLHQQKPGFHHRLINETSYHSSLLSTAFW